MTYKYLLNIQEGEKIKISRDASWQEATVMNSAEDNIDVEFVDGKTESISRSSARFYPLHCLFKDYEKQQIFLKDSCEYGKIIQNKVMCTKPKQFTPHECDSTCMTKYFPFLFRGQNPYLIPMLLGWARDAICLVQDTAQNSTSWRIMYTAPCGKRLRSMTEIAAYLDSCENELGIDSFCFDPWLRVLDEFVAEKNNIDIPDITQGKEENPISAVNSFDETVPLIDYLTEYSPQGSVEIPKDSDFLTSCDCTDNCQNKKCSCSQLTIKATALDAAGQYVLSDAGFDHRRLKNIYFTGVYECNSLCQCSASCHNKVTQRPIQAKLQVFKTPNRGWGLRTLFDLPEGAFICKYIGNLFNSVDANKEGEMFGDDYFCELDLIEIVERNKEGYESDVTDIEEDDINDEEIQQNGAVTNVIMNGHADNLTNGLANISMNANIMMNGHENVNKSEPMNGDTNEKINGDANNATNRAASNGNGEVPMKGMANEPINGRANGLIDDKTNGLMNGYVNEAMNVIDSAPMNGNSNGLINGDINESMNGDVNDSSKRNVDSGEEDEPKKKFKSIRKYYPEDGRQVYLIDAMKSGNVGRYLNHSCDPNVYVQNVFHQTHDLRFPMVAFFTCRYVRAGEELCWNYDYDVDSVPGRRIDCFCGAQNCRKRLL